MADLIAALNGSHRLMWFFRETKQVTNFGVPMHRQATNWLAATSGNQLANCDGWLPNPFHQVSPFDFAKEKGFDRNHSINEHSLRFT